MAKILIVDDDPDVVEACAIVLKHEGYDVVSANNRNDGMAVLEKENPDLMILDVMMEQPDDGLAMAQEIRRLGNNIPIIMLTSISKVVGREYGKDEDLVPVNEFFEKPIEPSVLVEKVKSLLS